MEFITSQVSPVQWEEDISNSASVCLNFFPNDNGSCAKQELQTLWEMFTSWLKPKEQTKEQIISQLVLEQFLKTGRPKDIAVKELWESSGRNLGKLMCGLTDKCLKPPVMQLVTASTLENERTPLPISQDRVLATGHEDSKDGQDYSWNSSEENGCVTSPVNEMDSLFIIQTDNFHDRNEGASDVIPLDLRTCQDAARNQEEAQSAASSGDVPMVQVQPGAVSDEITLNLRTFKDTARYQEELQRAASSGHVPMVEVQPGFSSRQAQTEDFQNHAAKCTCDSHHKRLYRDTNSNLSLRKKVQKKERSFVCTTCHKGFYTVSDLRVHEIIHKEKKPFICPTCKRPFSHKTNLNAHKRIHTGEKPYTCSKCQCSFRQSSTYHRHQRNCHKTD